MLWACARAPWPMACSCGACGGTSGGLLLFWKAGVQGFSPPGLPCHGAGHCAAPRRPPARACGSRRLRPDHATGRRGTVDRRSSTPCWWRTTMPSRWRGPIAGTTPGHPVFSRRFALQAGAVGLLGLGMDHWRPFVGRAAQDARRGAAPARSVIFIFFSGGLAQPIVSTPSRTLRRHRGEFRPIATARPVSRFASICRCCARSHLWSLVRSLTHTTNDHSAGHQSCSRAVGSARRLRPQPPNDDWPSIAAVAGALTRRGTTCRRPWCCRNGWSTIPAGSSPASSPA